MASGSWCSISTPTSGHLGKSEVAGLAGAEVNAFGPVLARAGVTVLAPDAWGFEDRRHHAVGTTPHPDDHGWYLQELTHLLVRGDTLNRRTVEDALDAVSVLSEVTEVATIGALGHSFGGYVTLFAAAVDDRIAFACASGCAGTIRDRLRRRGGIGLDQVVPGILDRADLDVVAALITPRPLLLIAGDDDRYARDIEQIADHVRGVYRVRDVADRFEHLVLEGAHELTPTRHERIVGWVTDTCATLGR